jgi:hypothetical protein
MLNICFISSVKSSSCLQAYKKSDKNSILMIDLIVRYLMVHNYDR